MCVYVIVHEGGVLFAQWSGSVSAEGAEPFLSLFWELIPTSSAAALIITPQWPHILSCLLQLRHVTFTCTAQYCVEYLKRFDRTLFDTDLVLSPGFDGHTAVSFIKDVRERDVNKGHLHRNAVKISIVQSQRLWDVMCLKMYEASFLFKFSFIVFHLLMLQPFQ